MTPKDAHGALAKMLDELRVGAEQAQRETSPGWTVTVREDGTAQIYASSAGPLRQVVPIAETSSHFARYIAMAASPRVVLLLLKMIADRDRLIALHALSREMAEAGSEIPGVASQKTTETGGLTVTEYTLTEATKDALRIDHED